MNTPTGYSALDLVGFTDRGDYSSSETYVKNDLVHYLGDIWRVKLDDITGQTPSEGTYYTIFIEGIPDKAYKTDDTTENTLASDDVLPFYDTSASAKRKMPVQKFAEQLISNPNLLDNPWFTVNQRGQSSYTSVINANVYSLDRWRCVGAPTVYTVSIENDGISFSSGVKQIDQPLEENFIKTLLGKDVTLSIMLEDGSVVSKTSKMPTSIPTVNTNYIPAFTFLPNANEIVDFDYNMLYGHRVVIFGNENSIAFKVRAIKLELGSVSTLAMDTVPNYATELLKCQRYFVRVGSTSRIYLGTAVALDNDKATGVIKLPTTMRTVPTVTGITDLELSNGSAIAITALDNRDYNNGYLALTVSASGTTAGSSYLLRVKANSNIDFSADL